MSLKCSLRNSFVVHTYLVVSRTKITFIKELGTTQFIQEVINDMSGKFVFNGEIVECPKVRTHALRTFFVKDHDHKRRVGARTRTDNTCVEHLLKFFLNFIFLGKGITIGMDIGRKADRDKGNGMIMKTMGRRESLGSGKKNLMFGENGLEVLWNIKCLNGLDAMELCNNSIMTFFENIFHAMGTDDLQGTSNDSLEMIVLYLLVELHG
jgi:hypothetical protein